MKANALFHETSRELPVSASIIGSRGIPARYGGFEVFTEQLSTRLVEKGYSILVCCEYPVSERRDNYKGVRLHYFPLPPPNNYLLRKFYEILNDLYFIFIASFSNDIVYILGTGTAGWFTFFPKMINKNSKVIINIDGVEWRRNKFNEIEKFLIKLNNHIAIIFADIVILDAKCLGNYFGKIKKKKTVFIPYGVECTGFVEWDVNKLLILSSKCHEINNVKPNDYWLVIARLEPENNIHTILEGFLKSNSEKFLVIVGDSTSTTYSNKLNQIMNEYNNNKVLFVGSIYEDQKLLQMLRQNCFAYIHGHSVGGTNPSLLEAMVSKDIILAHDNDFNREVCTDLAVYFKDTPDIKNKIDHIEENAHLFAEFKEKIYTRAIREYSWENVVSSYESLFLNLTGHNNPSNHRIPWPAQANDIHYGVNGNDIAFYAKGDQQGEGRIQVIRKD